MASNGPGRQDRGGSAASKNGPGSKPGGVPRPSPKDDKAK